MRHDSSHVGVLRSRLHNSLTKATPARLAVLDLLTKAEKPVGVEALARELGKQFDQATLYRTVQTLEKRGLLRRVDFHHGRAYFELAAREEHHHAVCTQCGTVEDIHDCCAKSMEQIALSQSGFATIAQHALEFFGVCKRCAAKREE